MLTSSYLSDVCWCIT